MLRRGRMDARVKPAHDGKWRYMSEICSSGIATVAILDRLGIAAEMKPKTKPLAAGAKGATVANGEADIGFDR